MSKRFLLLLLAAAALSAQHHEAASTTPNDPSAMAAAADPPGTAPSRLGQAYAAVAHCMNSTSATSQPESQRR